MHPQLYTYHQRIPVYIYLLLSIRASFSREQRGCRIFFYFFFCVCGVCGRARDDVRHSGSSSSQHHLPAGREWFHSFRFPRFS